MARPIGSRAPRRAVLWRYALTALLGLPGRRGPASAGDRPRRDRAAASSYEAPVEAANELQFGRAYWLPPFGHGNGIDALFWTPLAALPERQVDPVLDALAQQGIPGWATVAAHAGRPALAARGRRHDLWVASDQLDEAQDVLLRLLAA